MSTRTYLLGSLVWMALIFYLSSLPGNRLGPDELVLNAIKKIGHFTIFGVLGALYLYSLKGKKALREAGGGLFLLSLLFAVLYAVSDEYHQSFVPGRHAAFTDVIIDSCGALTVLGSLYMVKTRSWDPEKDHSQWKNC